MKKILIKHIRKIAVIVLAFVLLICGGCSGSISNIETTNANDFEEDNNGMTENEVNEIIIQNDFSPLLGNNPNNYSTGDGFVYDENYIYYFWAEPGIDSAYTKLCRMKREGNEQEIVFDLNSYFGDSSLSLNDDFIYYDCSNLITRVNLESFKEENEFIKLPIEKDITRGNITYEAYTSIYRSYSIDNMIIYNYAKGYDGTSSNDMIATELYNLKTGQTINLGIDYMIMDFAFDGENLYFHGNESVIRIISLSELLDGTTSPACKEVIIEKCKSIRYIASNGFVVEKEDGIVAFYSFEDCEKLENGGVWKSDRIIHEETVGTVFEDKNADILLLTDSFCIYSLRGTIYWKSYEKKSSSLLGRIVTYGVVDKKIYFLGYDMDEQFVCITVDEDGTIMEKKVITEGSKDDDSQTETEEIILNIPDNYIDLSKQTYDANNGITIDFFGNSNGGTPSITLQLNNDTGYDLYLEMDGDMIVNGDAAIKTEVIYGSRYSMEGKLVNGENFIKIIYNKADLKEAGIEGYSLESVFFKFRIVSVKDAGQFEYTTDDLAIIFKNL